MIAGALVLIVIVGGILYGISGQTAAPTGTTQSGAVASGDHLALAQCLKDKGAVFYGAFWCPHCKAQKAEFGDAVPALPYVECSNPDGNSQTAICQQKGVQSYPTWIFPDGSRLTGEQTLEALAAKVGCDAGSGTSTPAVKSATSASSSISTSISTGAVTGQSSSGVR